jgi:hypothetical protein
VVVVKVEHGYVLRIPEQFQGLFKIGQDVAVSADLHRHLIVTPLEQINSALTASFGMWSNRDDIPADSAEYVDEIRNIERPAC